MGWILDTSGVISREAVEPHWLSVLRAAGIAAHVTLAGTYMMILTRFAGPRGDGRDGGHLPRPTRQVAALFAFCALANAGGAAATCFTRQPHLMIPSLLAAAFATLAARRPFDAARDATRRGTAPPAPAASRFFAALETSAVAGANLPAVSDDEEWVHLRLARMEDLARRDAWLLQRQEALQRLGSMISATQTEWPIGP